MLRKPVTRSNFVRQVFIRDTNSYFMIGHLANHLAIRFGCGCLYSSAPPIFIGGTL